jgi:hypothetical protein
VIGGPRLGSGSVIAEGGGRPRCGVLMLEEALAGSGYKCPPLSFGENRADAEEVKVEE